VLEAARGRENERIAARLWICVNTVRKSSGAGSRRTGWAGWMTCPGPAGRGGSARRTGQPSSRWPASCPRSPGCRCPAGPARR
jgi:hypothetical protein